MRTILRARRWIGLAAVLAVVLHAGALVRHGQAMDDAARQRQGLLVDLASLCHSEASAQAERGPELPLLPMPGQERAACPICLGVVPGFALLVPGLEPVDYPARAAPVDAGSDIAATGLPRLSHPPARGPPAFA
jgi:hypothetical protein